MILSNDYGLKKSVKRAPILSPEGLNRTHNILTSAAQKSHTYPHDAKNS